jgi:hypothetical protein
MRNFFLGVVVTLRPGSYEYLCSIPGHAKGGMHGLLDVLRDSCMKSGSRASRLTHQGETHE